MKPLLLTLFATGALVQAELVRFELGPNGMNATNEVPAVTAASTGTGGIIESGIWFDTVTSNLSFVIGYGSAAGFQDLTGPATAAQLRGPADTAGTAPVLFDLGPQHFLNSDPARGGILRGMVHYEAPETVAALLGGSNYVNLATAANPSGEIRGQLTVFVNRAPVVVCPPPVEAECHDAQLELRAKVSDPNGDALTVVWIVDGEARATNNVPATPPGAETDIKFSTGYSVGVHTVEVRATDGELAGTCSTQVTIVDRTSPVIHRIIANPSVLWPPNHQMVPVRLRVKVEDCSPVTTRIVSVTSNEPVNGRGDGNTAPDWRITGDLAVDLRSERAGGGSGRIYTITLEASDGINPPVQGSVQVRVPHSMGRSK